MTSNSQPLEPEDLTSIDDLLKLIGKDKRLQVVMYTTTWCQPCARLKKKIYDKELKEGLSKTYNNDVRFIYVDIDKNRELADEFKITSIPDLLNPQKPKDFHRLIIVSDRETNCYSN